jgi:DNA-binding NtrC family response regulator
MPIANKLTVFVVDDDAIISLTLAAILQQNGFDATSFINPLKALQAAESKRPDLLVSDVIMPEISGVDLAIQLKQVCPDCGILLFSGQAATADLLIEARLAGYDFTLVF